MSEKKSTVQRQVERAEERARAKLAVALIDWIQVHGALSRLDATRPSTASTLRDLVETALGSDK